jgi:hypothetical protein
MWFWESVFFLEVCLLRYGAIKVPREPENVWIFVATQKSVLISIRRSPLPKIIRFCPSKYVRPSVKAALLFPGTSPSRVHNYIPGKTVANRTRQLLLSVRIFRRGLGNGKGGSFFLFLPGVKIPGINFVSRVRPIGFMVYVGYFHLFFFVRCVVTVKNETLRTFLGLIGTGSKGVGRALIYVQISALGDRIASVELATPLTPFPLEAKDCFSPKNFPQLSFHFGQTPPMASKLN